MASIRRTLSPVPRAGNLVNGEVGQATPSPLSKSSTSSQSYPTSSGGLLSSIFSLSDPQQLVLGVYSPRLSRLADRHKPRGQMWRRALFHFLVCFIIGSFIGLTPFVSMNLSSNVMSKQQEFSFETLSTVSNLNSFGDLTRNVTLTGNGDANNIKVESQGVTGQLVDGISKYTLNDKALSEGPDLEFQKLLIIITPTYTHPFQAYYLNHLAHTLKLVQPPLLWIVVERTAQSEFTADILRRTGVMYRHLVCNKNLTDVKDIRVHQRNVALSHIETHHLDGIVYFADEDNVYSVNLFEQMRKIIRFGTWTVAKAKARVNRGNIMLEGPVCNGTQVIGWHVDELTRRFRRFHADMSGFAFNSTVLWDPKRWHRPTPKPIRQLDTVKDGFQATTFIEQIVEDESQLEGLPNNCSRIMVWHLRLESSKTFFNSSRDVILQLV